MPGSLSREDRCHSILACLIGTRSTTSGLTPFVLVAVRFFLDGPDNVQLSIAELTAESKRLCRTTVETGFHRPRQRMSSYPVMWCISRAEKAFFSQGISVNERWYQMPIRILVLHVGCCYTPHLSVKQDKLCAFEVETRTASKNLLPTAAYVVADLATNRYT